MSDTDIHDPTVTEHLSAPDAAAVDALFDAAMDPATVTGAHRTLAERAAALLRLLRVGDVPIDDALVDVTLARIARAATANPPVLSREDAAALDAWVLAGYDAKKTPHSLRARVTRHQHLADRVCDVLLAPAAGDLIERTLARVQEEDTSHALRMRLQPYAERRGLGVRLADVVSVAAVLLIGAAIVWPLLTSLRYQNRRAVCFNTMNTAGIGFSTYAGDYRDQLPVANTELSGPWWNTGVEGQSNSANLYGLVRAHYVKLADLACPGNPGAAIGEADPDAVDWRSRGQVSFSYQIMYGPALSSWASGQPRVVLADRSPVVDVWVRGQPFFPLTNSRNHDDRGQHVLLTDGSAQWLRSPETAQGDNIWLPSYIEREFDRLTGRDRNRPRHPLTGTETPETGRDVFLGP